jgi:dTMP kinase
MTQARFIVLEGVDGSGTTLQSQALTTWLQARGHTVVQTHEPSHGAIGRMIREALRTEADPLDRRALALLFAADRLHHVQNVINPALDRGEVVVCDRYLMSSWAYQALDCDLTWVRAINHHAPWPDLTLYLDVPVDVALSRVRSRDGADPKEIFETESQQQRVAAIYHQLLGEGLEEVHTIDGAQKIESVTQALRTHCSRLGL